MPMPSDPVAREVTRAKMRAAALGRIPHNKGKRASTTTRTKMSEAKKAYLATPEGQLFLTKLAATKRGKKASDETRAKMSRTGKLRYTTQTIWNKGVPHSPETKKKLSAIHTGRKLSNEAKENMRRAQRALWQDKERSPPRPHDGALYHEWRRLVWERDNYTCQTCGAQRDLHAHHIKSWKNHPHLRLELTNGKTLCSACHYIYHAAQRRILTKLKKKAKA